MSLSLSSIILLVCPCFSQPIDIDVNGVKLTIPAPDIFQPIAPDMLPYARIAANSVGPSSQELVRFLAPVDVVNAAEGRIPKAGRCFSIRVQKAMAPAIITSDEFATVKQQLRDRVEELVANQNNLLNDVTSEANAVGRSKLGEESQVSLTEIIPLAVHYESENEIALSVIMKFGTSDPTVNPAMKESAETIHYLLVCGKLIELHVEAEKPALAWTRKASQDWADAIHKSNINRETSRRQGPDVEELIRRTLIGALVGGILGFLVWFSRKKTPKPST